jgi:hypothetical protein
MHRVLLIAAAGIVAMSASVEAASRHKHPVRAPRAAAQTTVAPVQRGPRVGPAWGGPNQCWTEEGYGRYAPCDGGGTSM